MSLLHLKRAATDRFFLFSHDQARRHATGEMCLWEDETPIGTNLSEIYVVSQQAISKRIAKIRAKLKNLLEN